jgi:hypothetical protein
MVDERLAYLVKANSGRKTRNEGEASIGHGMRKPKGPPHQREYWSAVGPARVG